MSKNNAISNIIFVVSVFIITFIAVLFSSPSSWFVWVSAILGILSSKMSANGKWYMFVFDILSYILYIYICLRQNYYGELILSYIIILINCMCLMEWRKNQQDEIVVINKLARKEVLSSLFVAVSSFFILIYFLTIMNSNQVILNALSTITYLLGSYFCYRRCIFQFYSWIIYEVIFISLWIISFGYGDMGSLIFLVDGIIELVYNIIGIWNWKRIKEKQIVVSANSFKTRRFTLR